MERGGPLGFGLLTGRLLDRPRMATQEEAQPLLRGACANLDGALEFLAQANREMEEAKRFLRNAEDLAARAGAIPIEITALEQAITEAQRTFRAEQIRAGLFLRGCPPFERAGMVAEKFGPLRRF